MFKGLIQLNYNVLVFYAFLFDGDFFCILAQTYLLHTSNGEIEHPDFKHTSIHLQWIRKCSSLSSFYWSYKCLICFGKSLVIDSTPLRRLHPFTFSPLNSLAKMQPLMPFKTAYVYNLHTERKCWQSFLSSLIHYSFGFLLH